MRFIKHGYMILSAVFLILSSLKADDWMIGDSSVFKFSKVQNINALNARIEIKKTDNTISFGVTADSNVSYTAECSRWSIEPMDSFKLEKGFDYPGYDGCFNIIRKLYEDSASLKGMDIIDFIMKTHCISLDSLYKLKPIIIKFPTDSVVLNSPKDIKQFINKGPKMRIFLLTIGEFQDLGYYSLYDGVFDFTVKFELLPCGYDTGVYNGNDNDCKAQYFKTTWMGTLKKRFRISKFNGVMNCTELDK
jgi:hypothetical protein